MQNKTAVVYDKWLHSMGGGEVVACTIASILKKVGYKVIFVSGKETSKERISSSLNIDMSGIEFRQVWNDEVALKKIVAGQDLFVNVTFMDYNRGFAKKNLYYTHFPTKPYSNLRGMFFNKLIIPLASKLVVPFESVSSIDAPLVLHNNPAYLLLKKNRYALSSLETQKTQEIEFKILVECFDKEFLENLVVELDDAKVLERTVRINHRLNVIHYKIKFIPKATTIYLNLNINRIEQENYGWMKDKAYLLYPKIQTRKISNFVPLYVLEKINNRLRAGFYANILERLATYQKILANSYFTQKWIKNYWDRDSIVLPPPVSMLYKKHNMQKVKKKNWICSVGRFFTLGHGKKQEILIEAFKRLHKENKSDWELHLVGGLGDEPSSIEFFKYLKKAVKGYPIYFHINAPRDEVEKIYLTSKIYWHATGFGEDKNYQPIRFEHFGIAPIEAISARCIPVLFNGGGLQEIINTIGLGKKKNLFSTIEELVKNTKFFQTQSNQKLNWDYILKQIDLNYSKEAFEKKFLELISK